MLNYPVEEPNNDDFRKISKEAFIAWLISLPIEPKIKKYWYIKWCRINNEKLTFEDVNKFYPREGG